MTQELKEPAHAVPDDGGAQVTHVHLFGDVGRGEIHHHLNTRHRGKRWSTQIVRKIKSHGGQTLFLVVSGGGLTPLISNLLNSLETNALFRWMLMKPEQERHNHLRKKDIENEQHGPSSFTQKHPPQNFRNLLLKSKKKINK